MVESLTRNSLKHIQIWSYICLSILVSELGLLASWWWHDLF